MLKSAATILAVMNSGAVVGLCIMVGLSSACGTRKTWVGYAYPDRSNMGRHEIAGTEFATEADCMAQTEAYLRRQLGDNWQRGDLECTENDR